MVSVVVVAYNIEKYIERCLNSIINQSFVDLEIIVVNDGSTDKTLKKIQNIIKRDNRIIIIDKVNGGVNSARNAGLNESTGEYILFVDGDDWLELDAIDKLYKNIKDRNLDVLVYNAYKAYDTEKKELHTFLNDNSLNYLKDLLLAKIMPSIWCKFIRRKCIENIQFPTNTGYGEDLVVACDLFAHNLAIGTLNECLYNYYQRSDSITKSISSKILDLDKSFSLIEDTLRRRNIYDMYNLEYEYAVFNHIFIHQIIDINQHNEITRELYCLYKNRNIDIYNNKYIYSVMNEGNIVFRLRKMIYDKSYTLGKMYDFFRRTIKVG